MKKHILFSVVLCMAASQAFAVGVQGNVAAGKKKVVEVCATCHGVDGNKTLDNTYPKLAGQHADYLVKVLRDYKTGKRSNAIMGGQAKPLSEADIANISVYFNSLPSTIGVLRE